MSWLNRSVLPLILSSIAILAGCGNGGRQRPVSPPSGSFSVSDLNGTYVFSTVGQDSGGDFLAIAGTFDANGSGGVTGGVIDVNDSGFSSLVIGNPITGGSYNVTTDGRGQVTLTTSTPFGSSIKFDFALTSGTHGLITQFDRNGTGSGTLDLQANVSQAQIAGSYSFSFTGISGISSTTGAWIPFGTVGAFTLDANGNVTAGVEDYNNNGSSLNLTNLAITSGFVDLSTSPGTAELDTSAGQFTFSVYPVDSGHLKFIETDSFPIVFGDAFPQTSSIATTNVFSISGYDFSVGGPFTAAGLIATDGNGTVTDGIEDINDALLVSTQTGITGSYTAVSGGRSTLTVNGFNNGANGLLGTYQFAAYPSAGGLLLLEIDNAGLTGGTAYSQTSTSLASAEGYAFNLTGANFNLGAEEDDIAEFTNTNGSFSGIIDFNDQGSTAYGQRFTSTYAADSNVAGRGLISPGANGFNLVSYVVDGSTSVFVEIDNNQVGIGSYSLQTPSGAKSNFAVTHLATLRPKSAIKAGAKKQIKRHR